MTFYEYLEKNWDNAAIDHSLRVVRCSGGEIEFYIHPDGKDGDTPSFVVLPPAIDGYCTVGSPPSFSTEGFIEEPNAFNSNLVQ